MKRNILFCFLLAITISGVVGNALLGTVKIDDECADVTECIGEEEDNVECIDRDEDDDDDTKLCTCILPGNVARGNREGCLPLRTRLGQPCEENQQCPMGEGAYCSSTAGCSCHPLESVPSEDGRRCLKLASALDEECTQDDVCTHGAPGRFSKCVEDEEDEDGKSFCRCLPEALRPERGQTCLWPAGYGGTCDENQQCNGTLGEHAECRSRKCDCKAQFVINRGETQCIPVVDTIGGRCNETVQCIGGVPGNFSECRNISNVFQCQCNNDGLRVPPSHVCFRKAQLIGDRCNHTQQCTSNLGPLSLCKDNTTCACSEGALESLLGTKCLEANVTIGRPCEEPHQCIGSSTCIGPDRNKTCACNSATEVPNQSNTTCLLIQNSINGTCQETIQCQAGMPGRYSQCAGGRCNCTSAGVDVPGQPSCLRKATEIGDHCITPQQCTPNLGALSSCNTTAVNTTCYCLAGAIESRAKDKCLQANLRIGSRCEEDSQCNSTSTCRANVCSCRPGLEVPKEDNSTCLLVRHEVGDVCDESSQCQLGSLRELSTCDRRTCQCSLDAVKSPLFPQCLAKRNRLTDACQANEQCAPHLGPGSVCTGGRCSCNPSQSVPKTDNSTCLAKAGYNQACEQTNQCQVDLGTFSECVGTPNKTCSCRTGSVINSRNNKCLQIVNQLGGFCEEPVQCLRGVPGALSNCTSSQCVCTSESVQIPPGHVCHKRAKLIGESCQHDLQCTANLGQFTRCTNVTNGTCSCIPGFIANSANNRCLPMADKIGADCELEIQCTSGLPGNLSHCVSNKCACKPEGVQVPRFEVCFRKANEVGDTCLHNEQCRANLGANIECSGNATCKCVSNYVENAAKKKCLLIINEINGTCEETRQCTVGRPGAYSNCTGNRCQCTAEAIVVPGVQTCFKKATALGEKCEHNIQCTTNLGNLTTCHPTLNNCTCAPNYTESANKSRCLTIINTIGGRCEENGQCQNGVPGAFSFCNATQCQCNNSSIQINGTHFCFPKAQRVGDQCMHHQQCTAILGSLAECSSNNNCTCSRNAVPNGARNKCLAANIKIGQRCEDSNQCSGTSTCRSSICACNPILEVAKLDNSTCLPIRHNINETCEELLQCTSGNLTALANCTSGRCLCRTDAVKAPNFPACLAKRTRLSQACQANEQCSPHLGPGSTCASGACGCAPNQSVPKPDNTTCLARAGYRQPCEIETQCRANLGPLSQCAGTPRLCNCTNAAIINVNQTQCLAITNTIGGNCTERVQCTAGQPGPLSNCTQGKCACNPDAIQQPGQNVCLRRAQLIGDACREPAQCSSNIANSTCANSKCACSGDLVPSTDLKRCLPRSGLGGPCSDNGTCDVLNSSCRAGPGGGTCECNEGFEQLVNGACYRVAQRVGDSCNESNLQCKYVTDSDCLITPNQGRLCQCNQQSHVPNGAGTRCLVRVNDIGGRCNETVQCWKDNVECRPATNTTVCACKNGYAASQLPQRLGHCVEIIKQNGGNCTERVQCTLGIGDLSDCLNNKCGCTGESRFLVDKCYLPKPLEANCTSIYECHLGSNNNTICGDDRKCGCVNGANPYENPETNRKRCYFTKKLGQPCMDDDDCRHSIDGETSCSTTINPPICVCDDGFEDDNTNKACVDTITTTSGQVKIGSFYLIQFILVSVAILTYFR